MTNPGRMIIASAIFASILAGTRSPAADNPVPAAPLPVDQAAPPAPGAATAALSATTTGGAAASPDSPASVTEVYRIVEPVPATSTIIAGGDLSNSATLSLASSATVFQPVVLEAPGRLSSTEPAIPVLTLPSDEELHKRTILVMFPSAYAGHYGGGTGTNLNLFMSWFIGTFYNEKGLFIAPIFSLFLGADAKWAFLEDRDVLPGVALGYLGGLALPFTGGGVAASGVAKMKQTDVHNGYLVASKRFGPVAFSLGGMRGINRAFPRLIPMLRNASYTTKTILRPDSIWTVYGGFDASYREQHLKFEVTTFPGEIVSRPWLFQTHLDGFLGFDIAYLRDSIGYEVIGYYQIPFFRWPDKRQLEKEREKLAEKLLQAK